MKKKNEPWRILVSLAAIAYIVYMWVDKDILSTFTGLSGADAAPIAATAAAVYAVKAIGAVAVVLLIKWIIRKLKK